MNRRLTIRTGRKGRVALALGAVAIAGLTILGGAATANAASTPAPKPAAHTTTDDAPVIYVDCDPDLTAVQQGNGRHSNPLRLATDSDADEPTVVAVNCAPSLPGGAHSIPMKPSIDGGTEQPTLVEVPGAVPDLDNVQAEEPVAVGAVPQPIGEGKTTAKR
jgi:hypothetical protein